MSMVTMVAAATSIARSARRRVCDERVRLQLFEEEALSILNCLRKFNKS
ncbi:hypothetical protein HMPREF1572_00432 [Gardnerella vaginalis JCP7275]|nr:hypothetical protein HMPREF1572_00432 [Gardnerella vaginalis JCP7275]